MAEAAAQGLLHQPADLVAVRLQYHVTYYTLLRHYQCTIVHGTLYRTYLVYEPELHEFVRQRGGGVAAGHGARQLTVHLVVHAQEDRHLEGRYANKLLHHGIMYTRSNVSLNKLRSNVWMSELKMLSQDKWYT